MDESLLDNNRGLLLELLFEIETHEQIVSLLFLLREFKGVCDGNDKEGYDEDAPKANNYTNNTPEECLGIQITIAGWSKRYDHVPHRIVETIEILPRSFANWSFENSELKCKNEDRDTQTKKQNSIWLLLHKSFKSKEGVESTTIDSANPLRTWIHEIRQIEAIS